MDRGYTIKDGLIYGPEGYTGFYIENNRIFGARGYTRLWIYRDHIYSSTAGNTGFWIDDAKRIRGPNWKVPWVQRQTARRPGARDVPL